MAISFRRGCLLAGLVLWLPAASLAQEASPGPWAATVWGGWGTDGDIQHIPGIVSEFENSWFAGASLSRRFARMGEGFTWEVEAVALRHFGEQRHWEGDLALGLRWADPFWTGSLGLLSGVSMASRLPVLEERIDPPTRKLLHFLGIEAAFSTESNPAQEFVLRLHHRSDGYGLYGISGGGSNFAAIGYRRRF